MHTLLENLFTLNFGLPKNELISLAIWSPYIPYTPIAPAAASGNDAARKGTPRVGTTIACLSSAFGLVVMILKLVGFLITVDKIGIYYECAYNQSNNSITNCASKSY